MRARLRKEADCIAVYGFAALVWAVIIWTIVGKI